MSRDVSAMRDAAREALTTLALRDFRNLAHVDLEIPDAGAVVIVGDVGAGLASGQMRAGLDVDVVALDAGLASGQMRAGLDVDVVAALGTPGSPGPRNDWPVARSYSQPCHGQASSVASASSWKSPGPLDRAHGATRPWHSGPPWCGQRLRIP